MTYRTAVLVAAIAAFLAVAAGTFGAHGLEGMRTADQVATWEIGVRYHMFHALAILACAGGIARLGRGGRVAVPCFALGIVVFSGSLYALVLLQQRWLGAVTPIGGVAFLIGWAALAIGAARRDGRPEPATSR